MKLNQHLIIAGPDGKPVSGLLADFISRRSRDYIEPTRKGIPKGEQIGFSQEKYYASLLALTSIELKQQSKQRKISYGLLRNWHCEQAFDEQVEKNIKDFIPIFLEAAKRLFAEDCKRIKNLQSTVDNTPELQDRLLYETLLIGRIFQELNNRFDKLPKKSPNDRAFLLYVVNIFRFSKRAFPLSPEQIRKREKFYNQGVTQVLDGVIEVLNKPKITPLEKKYCIYWLDNLKEGFID